MPSNPSPSSAPNSDVNEYSATYTIEFVTPAFLAGADPTKPEIHIPSIRGALRYWLRAAAGGVYGTSGEGLKKVREAEAAVFGGSAGEGKPMRGSPVVMWAKNLQGSMSAAGIGNARRSAPITDMPLQKSQSDSLGYLFWMMAQDGVYVRSYLTAGASFDLTTKVLAYRLPETTEHSSTAQLLWQQLEGALWLLVHLGGIGSRSRRGAGSLIIPYPPRNLAFDFTFSARADILQQKLVKNIQAIQRLWGDTANKQSMSSFDVLAPGACRIWILEGNRGPWKQSKDALSALGASLKVAREQAAQPERLSVAEFGLPRNAKIPITFESPPGKDKISRRASPISFHVHPLREGSRTTSYVLVATLFKSQFLREGAHVLVNNTRKDVTNYQEIEDWIENGFSGKATKTEVKPWG